MPCTTPEGDGYIWYIKSNGMFENDEFTVVLCNDGTVRHFNSGQIKIWVNATYGIEKRTPYEDLEKWLAPKNENPD